MTNGRQNSSKSIDINFNLLGNMDNINLSQTDENSNLSLHEDRYHPVTTEFKNDHKEIEIEQSDRKKSIVSYKFLKIKFIEFKLT